MPGNPRAPIAVIAVLIIIAISGYYLVILPNVSTISTTSAVTTQSNATSIVSIISTNSPIVSTSTSTTTIGVVSTVAGVTVPVTVNLCIQSGNTCNSASAQQLQLGYNNGGNGELFLYGTTDSNGNYVFNVPVNGGEVIVGCTSCGQLSVIGSNTGTVANAPVSVNLEYGASNNNNPPVQLSVLVQLCNRNYLSQCTPEQSVGVTIRSALGFNTAYTNNSGYAVFSPPSKLGTVSAACTYIACTGWVLTTSNSTTIGTLPEIITLSYIVPGQYCISAFCASYVNLPNAVLVTLFAFILIYVFVYKKKLVKAAKGI